MRRVTPRSTVFARGLFLLAACFTLECTRPSPAPAPAAAGAVERSAGEQTGAPGSQGPDSLPAVGRQPSAPSAARPPTTAFSVEDLRCEGLSEAEQVDTMEPRFSWRLEATARDVRQTAYQLRVESLDGRRKAGGESFLSPRIESVDSQWVTLKGFRPRPRTTYTWQVRVWNNHGDDSGWSTPRRFSTGLLGDKWPADWIGDGRLLKLHETAPARYFRNTFKLERLPVRARLFVSAQGIVEPWINGSAVSEDRFSPGWPDYRHRLFYVAYEVTALLRKGENAWGMMLGDGWYSGTLLPHHQFGQQPRVSAFLDLTDANGRVTTLTTGADWVGTDEGPIRMNSIYHGETYEAGREHSGWSTPSKSDDWTWRPVVVLKAKHPSQSLLGRLSPPVRRVERIKPARVTEVEPGVFIYDLGQNIVGWARLRVQASRDQWVQMRFSEMLGPDGRLFLKSLRTAQATARYRARGEGIEQWEPRFTFFGFRYIELTGVEQPLEDAIEGVVVHSDLPRTGTFESSDPWLGRLYQNALWSQKGNFLELPTDCPQRDERLGWTGDAQVFAPTALYNLDSGSFFRQWLFSVRDGLRDGPDGGFPDTAPHTGWGFGSPGWGDAGIIIPWITWLHTGDQRILSESFPAIQHAVELMASQAPDGIRRSKPAWGDWLAPGFERYKAPPRNELIATAYYAHSTDLASRIAAILGRPEAAAGNAALRDKAKAAFQREFIAPDGRVADDVQTSYLLALGFDLVPAELRSKVVTQLVRTLAQKDNHLATGFLGTALLTPVLSSVGRTDLAYTVLQKKTFPGWLFSVKNGATTIWERWDSWTPEQGFNPHNMNSFNHYAYGSVVSWLYDTVAGLQPLADAPGWKRFRIAPSPGGGLTRAASTLRTPHGLAASRWEIEDGALRLNVSIPPNTHAQVEVPTRDPARVFVDGGPLAQHTLASGIRAVGERTSLTLPSGTYELTVSASEQPGAGPR